jgi:hypothetical protein
MGNARHLAAKFKRAVRNDTGTHFTAEELRLLGEWGLLSILLDKEAEELSAKWAGPNNDSTPWGASGSPSAPNPRSTRSAGMTRQQRQLGVRALVAGRS